MNVQLLALPSNDIENLNLNKKKFDTTRQDDELRAP